MTGTEASCQVGTICGKSSTSNVAILPLTVTFENLPTASPGAANGVFIAGSNAATSANITGNITGNVLGNVTGSVGSVTAAVPLPSIPANWITSTGINAGALNGKGDWMTTLGSNCACQLD